MFLSLSSMSFPLNNYDFKETKMNTLEKIKLSKALQQAIIARDKSKKPLEKLKFSKEVQSLRQQLGLITVINSKDKISTTETKNNETKVIDEKTLNTDLSAFKTETETFSQTAHRYFNEYLKGNIVKTEIGDVYLLGSTWQEMKRGLPSDEIKCQLIPYVPQILSSGNYDGKRPLTKERNDNFIAFHAFSKEVTIVDKRVLARVTVGERDNGQYIFTAYSLHRAIFDSIEKNKNLLQGYQVGSLSLARGHAITSDEVTLNLLDDIVNNDDGWNIEILSITDLNGNPIDLDQLDKAANTEENPQSSPNLAAETDVDNPNPSDKELLAEFNKEKLR